MIRYCKSCIMPSTKPDLLFNDEGICNACTSFVNRSDDEYVERQSELSAVLEKYKSNNSNYDCIIPVSGGKDSTYQVIKVLELGLNPLCVTSTTCDESELGRRNIRNMGELGVDSIKVTPNPNVRRKLNKIGLKQVGDISWPEHVGIFTIPVQMAVKMNIPLIIWGENSQHEYGGPATAQDSNVLDRRWLEEFGGLLGLRVNDIVGQEDIKKEDLLLYEYPSDEELKRVGVTGLFLGYYFPWDGLSNTLISTAYGFESLPKHVEGSMVNYENLDNHQTGIHDYFKFLKFGFGRTTDLVCTHIRRGRISREIGVEIVKRNDGCFPWTCLGKSLDDILKPLDISVDDFIKICDRHTNKRLFEKDANGNLKKDRNGNLIKVSYDNS